MHRREDVIPEEEEEELWDLTSSSVQGGSGMGMSRGALREDMSVTLNAGSWTNKHTRVGGGGRTHEAGPWPWGQNTDLQQSVQLGDPLGDVAGEQGLCLWNTWLVIIVIKWQQTAE